MWCLLRDLAHYQQSRWYRLSLLTVFTWALFIHVWTVKKLFLEILLALSVSSCSSVSISLALCTLNWTEPNYERLPVYTCVWWYCRWVSGWLSVRERGRGQAGRADDCTLEKSSDHYIMISVDIVASFQTNQCLNWSESDVSWVCERERSEQRNWFVCVITFPSSSGTIIQELHKSFTASTAYRHQFIPGKTL